VTGIALASISLSHGMSSVGGPACGMGLNGIAYCWGPNDYGQAGTGTRSATPILPTPVASPAALVSVVAGGEHACGLTADGTALCWGADGSAVLGYPVSYPGIDSIPGVVQAAPKFTKLQAGLEKSCGLTGAGAAYCWGTVYGASPRTVSAPSTLKELHVEVDNVCAIGNDQVAYCWNGLGSVYKVLGQP
jgi:alpha-tubulin suppressor-like RCC1 family protein